MYLQQCQTIKIIYKNYRNLNTLKRAKYIAKKKMFSNFDKRTRSESLEASSKTPRSNVLQASNLIM